MADILYKWRKNINAALLQLALKGIKINKGYYDVSKREVWS